MKRNVAISADILPPMNVTQFNVAVIGADAAGMSCARHLQSDACRVTLFDAATTVCDIWHEGHEGGWRIASLEAGAHAGDFDALVLALPAPQAAALLAPLLPATAMEVAAMLPSSDQCIWLPAVQLGLCGDWLCGGQEGDAWLSGRALAARMLSQRASDQNSMDAVRPKVRGAPSTR
ncbi:NAD(P)-binding protein [Duganella levis]|uniref:NAD(P)-binding protein n=1 Tax=Duganella levis TaxID=2692169 RepID=A0ABW9VUN4_9BURK|nr:FAD/NAD(P)-binding protein [Duganella levis]MYN25336.1 NAD(P)-binding protein [Duganella levis]